MSFKQETCLEPKYFRRSLSTVNEIVEMIEEAKVFLKDLKTMSYSFLLWSLQ